MAYPDRYAQTELEYGKPMALIIADLLNKHSRDEAIAILNVNPATFWRWSKRAGVKRCYVAIDCERIEATA